MNRLGLFLLVLLLAACRPTSPVAPRSQSDDQTALRQLLLAEAEAVVKQDVERLAGLWAADGVVIDARHTADNQGDDATWRGRDAILDRYMVLVFPGNPQFAEPTDISFEISGDTAKAVSTTRIGDEVSPAGDRWEFRFADGRWWITSLTYNLEP
ncbi:MAG: nuclear transport factor 2 family protein [Caldilineales bacterium]|nr:nuclear transport factor 2 family protein [Caldilineales bacterium]MCW5858906.1 nuclear transport factor 2 family protein [Caldilineales bacterium]